jgi:hypothetical protein
MFWRSWDILGYLEWNIYWLNLLISFMSTGRPAAYHFLSGVPFLRLMACSRLKFTKHSVRSSPILCPARGHKYKQHTISEERVSEVGRRSDTLLNIDHEQWRRGVSESGEVLSGLRTLREKARDVTRFVEGIRLMLIRNIERVFVRGHRT